MRLTALTGRHRSTCWKVLRRNGVNGLPRAVSGRGAGRLLRRITALVSRLAPMRRRLARIRVETSDARNLDRALAMC